MSQFKKHSLTVAKAMSGALLFGALAGCNTETVDGQPLVIVPNKLIDMAAVQGTWLDESKKTVRAFKGIKYAQAPVGNLRFAAPKSKKLAGEVMATEFGSACPQVGTAFGEASVNEDCLSLNVYSPGDDANYPVMVWFHGGALIYGSGGETYTPERLVEEGTMVVTVNYRLGTLGFLSHPALTAETGGDSGNYGLMDQQAALKWVKKYIKDFGGNPDNVTIFGESAGGHSVMSQMAAPSSEGLFDKAIVQSGSYVAAQIPLATAELIGTGMAAVAGCYDPATALSCLRGLTVEQILAGQGDAFFMPTAGTNFLPKSIAEAFATNDFNAVPVISGTNLNEGTLFAALDGPFFDEASYRAGVASFFAQAPILNADQIATDYLARTQGANPVNPYTTYNLAYSSIYTDSFFACTNIPLLSGMSAAEDVYAYHFTDTRSFNLFASVLPYPMGASHTNDIQYVFGTDTTFVGDESQRALSDAMVDYWANFAKTGTPNGGDLTHWDSFAVNGGSMINLNDAAVAPSHLGNFAYAHNCGYWAAPPMNF